MIRLIQKQKFFQGFEKKTQDDSWQSKVTQGSFLLKKWQPCNLKNNKYN